MATGTTPSRLDRDGQDGIFVHVISARSLSGLTLILWCPGELPGQNRKPTASFLLHEVRSYGNDDTEVDRPLDTVLGEVTAIAITPDGKLGVLDRRNLKLMVFNADGSIERAVEFRKGKGPGEVTTLSDLSFGPQGDIWILDGDARRILRYTPKGIYDRMVSIVGVRPLWFALARTGELWVSHFFNSMAPYAVTVFDTTGKKLRSLFPMTDRDLQFGENGSSGIVATAGGLPAFANGRPGTWFTELNGSIRRLGADVFPNQNPTRIETPNGPMMLLPGGTYGLVSLATQRVGIVYYERIQKSNPQSPIQVKVDIFRADGDYLGTAAIPTNEKTRRPAASADGRFLYIATMNPYPRVVMYEIIEQRR